MSNQVKFTPSWAGALALWVGSDHYQIRQVLRREPFVLPVDRVSKVYMIHAKSIFGFGDSTRFAVEYQSEARDCFITLESLPPELKDIEPLRTKPPGAALAYFRHCCKEPTALFLPLLIPVFIAVMLFLLSEWTDLVLSNHDILSFFARPGCEMDCVKKVLSIHTYVAFLFLVQICLMLLPLGLLLFHAPRYRSAVNYRMIQSYSLVTVCVGVFVFLQLVVFFPFRQYTRFVGLGFDPKVERVISGLKSNPNTNHQKK